MKKIAIVFALLSLLPIAPSFASGEIAGATLPEQIVQEATLVEQLNQEVQMVQQGFQSLYNQALNLKNIGRDPTQNLNSLLHNLISTISRASMLSYAGENITAQFQSLYPDWQPGQDYGQQYQNWRNTTQTNLQNELTAAGLQAQNFQTETDALNEAKQLSQSAEGNLQALQAGNQISSMMVQQLQLLRQLVMNEQQSQVAYQMQQLRAEQDANNQSNKALQSFVGTGGAHSLGSAGSMSIGSPFQNYGR
jgi:P-type conjugative transfer protein TrbJ